MSMYHEHVLVSMYHEYICISMYQVVIWGHKCVGIISVGSLPSSLSHGVHGTVPLDRRLAHPVQRGSYEGKTGENCPQVVPLVHVSLGTAIR